jgi:hypothetical protein
MKVWRSGPLNLFLLHAFTRRAILSIAAFVCAMQPTLLRAQDAVTTHNVVLRRDPSTKSPKMETLEEGTRLSLVDEAQDSGFYHVRTEDDDVGWVFAKFLKVTTSEPPAAPSGPASPFAADGCDASLLTHIYHPKRLIVKAGCIAVTGTIVDATAPQKTHHPDGTRHEGDGDTHGWLKVDTGFEDLLNDGNKNDEDGNLVYEIICRFPVKQKDAKAVCAGFHDGVVLPPIGSHVRITGRYVQDTFHGQWNEIHPVTKIEVIP